MKSRLLIAAVFLLAGAVMNVAVAWGYATGGWLPLPTGTGTTIGLDQGEAQQVLADRLGVVAERFHAYKERSVGFTFLVVTGYFSDRPDHHVQVLTTGWPCLALEGHWGLVDGQPETSRLLVTRWERRDNVVVFPFYPIWPGFAANTIFYATFLWLLIPGPLVLRRFIRVKRGRCVKCGYPLGESAVCSECGKALSSRAGVA